MKLGKNFHFIAALLSMASTFAMLLPIASLSGSVNMIKSALGIDCTATWSNTAILIIQIIMIILNIFIIISAAKKYKNYHRVKFIRVIQITLSSIMVLFAFLTLSIIGVPSGAGISLGAGPIIFGIVNLLVILFIILSFVYLNKKEDIIEETTDSNKNVKNVKNKEAENIDLLLKYKELYNKKIITKQEFEKKKKELLK